MIRDTTLHMTEHDHLAFKRIQVHDALSYYEGVRHTTVSTDVLEMGPNVPIAGCIASTQQEDLVAVCV